MFRATNGETAVNTLTVHSTGVIAPSTLQILVDYYIDWFTEVGGLQVSTGWSLVQVSATDLTVQNGQNLIYALPAGQTGGLSSPAMPSNVTFATSFRTGYAGRSKRGRAYWVGLAESQVSGNYLTTLTAEAIRLSWEQFGAGLSGGLDGFTHVVTSYYENGAPRVTAAYNEVTSYVNVDNRVDTQRRRLPTVG